MIPNIESINIKKFRGIIDLSLDLDGKSLIIQGDNGTGKSSFIDAIEYFFTNSVDHLTGTRGISLNKHGPHMNCKDEDCEIIMEFEHTDPIRKEFKETVNIPEDLEDFFNLMKEKKFILHRGDILNFIITQPAKRFKAFADILGIGNMDEIELSLKRTHDKTEDRFEKNGEEIQELVENFSEEFNINLKDQSDIINKINQRFDNHSLPGIHSLQELKNYREKNIDLQPIPEEKIEKRIEYKNILQLIEKILDFEKLNNTLTNLETSLKVLKKEKYHMQEKMLNLLNSGYNYIKETYCKKCPLCNQNIDPKSLLNKIDKKISDLTQYSKNYTEYKKSISSFKESFNRKKINIKSLLDEIEDRKFLKESYNQLKKIIKELYREAGKFKEDTLIENMNVINNFREVLKRELESTLEIISSKCEPKYNSYNFKKKKSKEIYDLIDFIKKIHDSFKRLKELEKRNKRLKRKKAITKKVFTLFSNTKNQKVQEIHRKLSKDIKRFYSFIHPNEQHRNPELSVDLDKRASTDLTIQSFGKKNTDPRALTSEGHLDSLGLCIFLAYAKNYNEECPLIILDDVVSSVDANHREKIAELIINEFNNYQLIITTHDYVWYKQLEHNQIVHNVRDQFKNIKFIDWSLNEGPKISNFRPKWKLIEDNLDEGDKISAGASARSYLEWILKEICEKFNVPVSFKRDSKLHISDLFGPMKSRIIKDLFKKRKKDQGFKAKIERVLTNLKKQRFMANLLAHDNPEIDDLSLKEVERFCNSVRKLHYTFRCPSCLCFLEYKRETKEVRCTNEYCSDPFIYRLIPQSDFEVDGNMFIDLLDLSDSEYPQIGKMKPYVEEKIEAEEISNNEEEIKEYILKNEERLRSL